MDTRELRKYVKPLQWQAGPEGLYPGELYWMEGDAHMEGIGLSFAFTYVKEPCTFHPVTGMITHPYDEVLVFGSLDPGDIRTLGGTVSITLGAEGEVYTFNKSTAICIPAGLPHGPLRVLDTDKPFVHYALSLNSKYSAAASPAPDMPSSHSGEADDTADAGADAGGKYAHLIKDFYFHFDPDDKSEMGYAMAVENGVAHPADAGVGPGNADNLIWLFGDELEDFEVNFTWGHYSRCGKWHRAGETQTHPEEEAIFFVGLNPYDPSDFQAEMEQGLGPDGERYIINSPSVYVIPPDLEHLPVLIRWVDEPYGLVVVGLAGPHASTWKTKAEDLI
ncbi:MAG: hypothetical protein LBN35_03770 [Clostridiales Family XIII bacterium]|jgi:hypothetical protein|nr:hypothetical protein [Clostridiales Family XIII bacterium]